MLHPDQVDFGELDVKDSVDLATAAALPACTAAGSKVGKTLTADAVGVLTVDGIVVVLGNRILVKDQVTGADNGIYKCTTEGTVGVAFVLTRAVGCDEDAEVTAGMFAFVSKGTANGNGGFRLTTNDPITVDTDALVFTQVSGAGQITAGTGLTKTGNTIDTIGGDGILANADDLAVDLHATNPGLEIDTAQLRVKADGFHGIVRGASGVELELDDTPDTLDVDGDGLKVVGLPPLFKIDDVAVGALVTAPNLDLLTDASNADALHEHTLDTGVSDVTVLAAELNRIRPDVTLAGATPVRADVAAWADGDRGIGIGTGGVYYLLVRESAVLVHSAALTECGA